MKQFNTKFIKGLSDSEDVVIGLNEVFSLPLHDLVFPSSRNWFFEAPGVEHYKLLSYIANNFTGITIMDIGTNVGSSAIALAINDSNKVISYDLEDCRQGYGIKDNIEYRLKLATEDVNDINDATIIFLDTKNDGIFENEFRNKLIELNWKGYLFLDDIHLNAEMVAFWNSITQEKIDLTKIGHWSGTGVVIFE